MDVLNMLKELNRIEHLLDTREYQSSLPLAEWYERREKIRQELEEAGFTIALLDAQEVGMEGNGQVLAVFTPEMREGYPEEW